MNWWNRRSERCLMWEETEPFPRRTLCQCESRVTAHCFFKTPSTNQWTGRGGGVWTGGNIFISRACDRSVPLLLPPSPTASLSLWSARLPANAYASFTERLAALPIKAAPPRWCSFVATKVARLAKQGTDYPRCGFHSPSYSVSVSALKMPKAANKVLNRWLTALWGRSAQLVHCKIELKLYKCCHFFILFRVTTYEVNLTFFFFFMLSP